MLPTGIAYRSAVDVRLNLISREAATQEEGALRLATAEVSSDVCITLSSENLMLSDETRIAVQSGAILESNTPTFEMWRFLIAAMEQEVGGSMEIGKHGNGFQVTMSLAD